MTRGDGAAEGLFAAEGKGGFGKRAPAEQSVHLNRGEDRRAGDDAAPGRAGRAAGLPHPGGGDTTARSGLLWCGTGVQHRVDGVEGGVASRRVDGVDQDVRAGPAAAAAATRDRWLAELILAGCIAPPPVACGALSMKLREGDTDRAEALAGRRPSFSATARRVPFLEDMVTLARGRRPALVWLREGAQAAARACAADDSRVARAAFGAAAHVVDLIEDEVAADCAVALCSGARRASRRDDGAAALDACLALEAIISSPTSVGRAALARACARAPRALFLPSRAY